MDSLLKIGPLTVQSGQVASVRDHAFGGVIVELRDGRKVHDRADPMASAVRFVPAAQVLAKAPGSGA